MPGQRDSTVDLEEAKKAIQKLSPNSLCLGGLLDLRGVVGGVVNKVISTFLLGLFGVSPIGSLVGLVGAGIAEVADKSLRRLLERWGIAKNETIECLRNIVNAAKEASQYIDDEGLRGVVEEVASKWGWDVDTFRRFVKTAAGKSVTEDEVREMIEGALKRIEEELNKVKTEVKGLLVDAKVFFIDDVENGLLYGNFIVKGGVPKIQLGTAENEPEIDLVDTGKFREVAEDVLSRLTRDGRVVLTGPRGIGKSTLATYVTWRSLLGGLGKVALDKSMDAVIRVDSLNPGDALELNNLIKTAGRRFIVIYDPSPIKAYYKPEAMQVVKHGIESDENTTLRKLIESVKNTLRELMEVRNAWVVIILPRELYDEVLKSEELRNILNEIRSYIIDVDLRDEGFLREIVKRYSGCGDVSEHLVERIMEFDSYTLIAKYVGVWLRENKCQVKDVDEALRESAGEPKLFFAHYIWGIILGKKMDLAKKASIPLILHATFGPIPEGFTYITKAVSEGGGWKLIDRNELAESKLEDLREDDLEPIAKWLSTWHEDLIEETLEELAGLRGKEARKQYMDHGLKRLIETLDRSYEEVLKEVRKDLELGKAIFEKFLKETINVVQGESELKKTLEETKKLLTVIEVKPEKVEANLLIFISERLKNALKPYTNCWKRAALIIGHALAGRVSVPRPEDLPSDVVESLGDALRECDVDYYLLVGNEIPPLITMGLGMMGPAYTLALAWAFIDRYNEAIGEVNRILNIARGKGISVTERLYGLGLASIIAKAVESGKPVGLSDADAALYIASSAIQRVVSADRIIPILSALEPLRAEAPHRYLELLAFASDVENLDLGTVRYIFYELNGILDKYSDAVKGHAWSLVHAIRAYANLLSRYPVYFSDEEVKDMVGRVANLLNELGKFKSSLGVIAWAALAPALIHEDVKEFMEKALRIDVVDKEANEVLGRLSGLREKVKDLMRDEEFMGYIKSRFVKADEEAVKKIILGASSLLKHALAQYRLKNDELDKAEKLSNEAAKEYREIGSYENYLIAHGLVLRVEAIKAIKGSLVGDDLVKLVDGFRQLYEETFKEEHFEYTAEYLSIASHVLGNYLVSLALMGDHETINKLLEEHLCVLNANKQVSVLTRLMLNALLSHRVELSGELKGKLNVKPEELIDAFGSDMRSEFLPALMVALEIAKPEDGIKLCEKFNDEDCVDFVLAVKGDSAAVKLLRELLINVFQRVLNVSLNLFKELGVDANEFRGLVSGLDGKSLVQLIAPGNSLARLALILYALVNGNKELAKAHALYEVVYATGSKLFTRLFLEAYKACCDLSNDEFRRAVAGLFFLHV